MKGRWGGFHEWVVEVEFAFSKLDLSLRRQEGAKSERHIM